MGNPRYGVKLILMDTPAADIRRISASYWRGMCGVGITQTSMRSLQSRGRGEFQGVSREKGALESRGSGGRCSFS